MSAHVGVLICATIQSLSSGLKMQDVNLPLDWRSVSRELGTKRFGGNEIRYARRCEILRAPWELAETLHVEIVVP